jgi:hypothetical protein
MTKSTKTLLTIGGIAVVGYILWKQGIFGGKKSFAGFTAGDDFLNFRGTTSRTRVGSLPRCGEGCQNYSGNLISSGSGQSGQCAVQIYDTYGSVTGLRIFSCTGTTESEISPA